MSTAEILAEAKAKAAARRRRRGEGGGEGGGEGAKRAAARRGAKEAAAAAVVARAHAAATVHISRADARGDLAADADALLTNDPDADADDLADIDTGTAAAKKPTARPSSAKPARPASAYARPAKKSPEEQRRAEAIAAAELRELILRQNEALRDRLNTGSYEAAVAAAVEAAAATAASASAQRRTYSPAFRRTVPPRAQSARPRLAGKEALVRAASSDAFRETTITIRRAGNGAPPPIGVSGAVRGGRPAPAGALNVNAYAPGAAWRSRPQPPREERAAADDGDDDDGAPDRLAQLRAVYGQTIGPALRGAGDVDGALLPPRGVYVGAGMSMRDGDAPSPADARRHRPAPPPTYALRRRRRRGRRVQRVGAEPTAGVRDAVHHAQPPSSTARAGSRARRATAARWSRLRQGARACEAHENAHLAIESDQALREDMLRGLMDEGVRRRDGSKAF